MESPSEEMRRLRDQLIKTINHAMFDSSDDKTQQEFLREMAKRMKISEAAMNALLRQSWSKPAPVPVLRALAPKVAGTMLNPSQLTGMATANLAPVPAAIPQSALDAMTTSPPRGATTTQTPPFTSTTAQPEIFRVNWRNVTPSELFQMARAAIRNGSTTEQLNAHFQRENLPGQRRLFIPQFTPGIAMMLFYIDPREIGFPAAGQMFPAELQDLDSIALNASPLYNYIDALKRHLSQNVDAQRALNTVEQQVRTYMSQPRQGTDIGTSNLRGWRDQLTILGRGMPTTPVAPAAAKPQSVLDAIMQAPARGSLPGTQIGSFIAPLPGGLLPNQTSPQSQQTPLSPTANRLRVPFTTFGPNQSATFADQSQLVYLNGNSKESQQLDQLIKVVDAMERTESTTNLANRQSYIKDIRELYHEMAMYRSINKSKGINLYDYIKVIQDFTDRLKDLQAKIAARPAARYDLAIDPEILNRPEAFRQSHMTLRQRDLMDLVRMANYLLEIYRDEVKRFGPSGLYVTDIAQFRNVLAEQLGHYSGQVGVMIREDEWIAVLRTWRDRIQDLVDQRKALGRRCVNDTDPWDGTPVVEIPDNEYIRLSNGMCWHIESLMEYIRGIDGLNSSKGLKGYTSAKIWDTDDDVRRISEHPMVVADKAFRTYFLNIAYGKLADKISAQTLEIMYATASILVSRGKPFDLVVKSFLTSEQYEIFMRHADGSAYKLKRIPKEQLEAIETAIQLMMKGKAVTTFWDYYDKLSQEEKDAISSFRSTFERDLRECRFGKKADPSNKLCVYIMANIILPIIYRVSDIKGIGSSFEVLNTSEMG